MKFIISFLMVNFEIISQNIIINKYLGLKFRLYFINKYKEAHMKKIIIIIFISLISFVLIGCGNHTLEYSSVYRDDYKTGGNIDFGYQPLSRMIIFGGEGQVIQYYDKNIVKGWTEEGNRVGFKIIPPKGLDNYQSGYAIIDNEKILSDEFYKSNEDNQDYIAQFFPIVREDKKEVTIKIIWQDGVDAQIYHLVIKEGTIFGQKG